MSNDPELAKFLHALGATDKEDIVSEERARRQQARQSRVAADIQAMDTDEQKVHNLKGNNFNIEHLIKGVWEREN